MEKFNKATSEFIRSITEVPSQIKKDLENKPVRQIVRASKLLSHPENLPKAILAYGLAKEAVRMDEEIHPLNLRESLLKSFGTDWLGWNPEMIQLTILRDQTNDLMMNKIMALQVTMTTDTPWKEWHIFENAGKTFNHQVPNFGLLQPLSVGECYTTMSTLNQIRPQEDFSEEVLTYIASISANDQFVYLPQDTLLGKAQTHLNKLIHDYDLRDQVRDAWSKIKNKNVLEAEFKDDDRLHVQLKQLALAREYIEEFDEQYIKPQN